MVTKISPTTQKGRFTWVIAYVEEVHPKHWSLIEHVKGHGKMPVLPRCGDVCQLRGGEFVGDVTLLVWQWEPPARIPREHGAHMTALVVLKRCDETAASEIFQLMEVVS